MPLWRAKEKHYLEYYTERINKTTSLSHYNCAVLNVYSYSNARKDRRVGSGICNKVS
jgi:hypothetical protein